MTNVVEIEDNSIDTKWNYSTFFITINTNRSENSLEQQFRKVLKEDLLPNIFHYLKWIDHNKKGELKDHIRDDWSASFKIEYGPKYRKLHTHILAKFCHTTMIRIDMAKIKSKVQDELGLSGIKVDVKVIDSQFERINDYLRKNPYKFKLDR